MASLKTSIKEILKQKRFARLAHRGYVAKTIGYPNWKKILKYEKKSWKTALQKAKNGPKVLIATSVGSHLPGTTLESLLGVALTLRGADIHVLLCDSVLPACLACDVTWYPKQELFVKNGPRKDLCKNCFDPANKMYRSLGFTIHRYSDLLTAEDHLQANQISSNLTISEIENYKLDGIAVGEHALAGALRFYARASLENEIYGLPILKRYFTAALLTTFAVKRVFKKNQYEAAVFHHGIYVPQGLVGEVARQTKVRVINWNPAYRKKCFIFSHHDTYHHTLMSEPVSNWENLDLTPELNEQLLNYLKSRWEGTEDWIWFHERPKFDVEKIAKEIGVDFTKPCIGMLTNVMWDAQLHYPANAFPNMLDWILKTIHYFSQRPELQLLIRVHPAEIRGTLRSQQPITEEIKKVFPDLPKNIFVIPPESQVSTYAVMLQCNSVIIYGTKTGVELASMGIPVIVAGEAWIRNKGITFDVTTVEKYFKLLDQLPFIKKTDEELIIRARKYAYHFFFRRMVPLKMMEIAPKAMPFILNLKNLEELNRKKCLGLDIICEGILKGSDFIYPAEEKYDF